LPKFAAGTACRRGLRFGARLIQAGISDKTARNADDSFVLAAAENKLPILNCRINVKFFQKLRLEK
jgi:hypothetical protein